MKLRTVSRLSVITLVVVVGVILYVAQQTLASPRAPSFAGTALGGTPAPNFVLVDQHGAKTGLTQARGAPVVLTFMATQCGTPCEQTAAHMREAVSQLLTTQQRVSVLIVSLDPTSDTPNAVLAFTQRLQMGANWHYLTGSCAALKQVWSAYGVAGAGCGPDASAAPSQALGLYVIDARGREQAYLDSSFAPSALATDLRAVSAG